jgi:ABC-type phosphate transport system substrate-binding protein
LVAGKRKISVQELDQLTYGYADRYFMVINFAMDTIKRGNLDPTQWRMAHQIKLNGVQSMNDILSAPEISSMPSYENTASGRYPLLRLMRIVFHRNPDGSMNPVAREFLRFAVSRRGQRIIALAESYPLTVEQQKEALRVIGEPPEKP